ncbi:hypothetical protein TEA_021357 [Camellia sinensis var. sinensis]|uniref:Helicase ATP-binding domain-containing protein n=1 Tax=Camellia sinensis var. sinensis TaxID=542762 RepID=A0A4S4D9D4_CAMSN|nr:hypothetical protein TEA_021357 [Camellia sinensis var. sinensis]
MDDEARVSGSLNPPEKEKEKEDVRGPSYWLDACEDIPCHFIDDFVDLDAAAISEAADGISNPEAGPDPCFFGGIDQILDSIKNGDGLPLALNGNGDNDSAVIRHCVPVGPAMPTDDNDSAVIRHCVPVGPASVGNGDKQAVLCKMEVLEDSIGACQNTNYSNGLLSKFDDANKNDNGGPSDSDAATETCKHRVTNSNGKKSSNHSPERNGVRRLETRGTDLYRDRDDEVSEGRYNKRPRVNDYNYKTERCFQNRGQYRPKERERPSGRKRPRDWEDIDRRERDQIRRRERCGSGKRDCRDRDWRESKGFWERERPGSNEMVFHLGTWESERNREGKAPSERNQDCIVKVEKKPEEAKEKHPEEQARQYQLDVLEQAKQKNTIAFLETGAGKTLIAVLLIKSVCSDLQMQNRRMLAVFLVPKVPLVYQQAEVIREQTGYQVGHYCGEMGQDFWDARRWQREFETKQDFVLKKPIMVLPYFVICLFFFYPCQVKNMGGKLNDLTALATELAACNVLVMTAQILLNILRHSIIKMEAINLLILDECHHAVKKHPYSLVMSEFYHTTPKENRPSVFGMTASPVNLKEWESGAHDGVKERIPKISHLARGLVRKFKGFNALIKDVQVVKEWIDGFMFRYGFVKDFGKIDVSGMKGPTMLTSHGGEVVKFSGLRETMTKVVHADLRVLLMHSVIKSKYGVQANGWDSYVINGPRYLFICGAKTLAHTSVCSHLSQSTIVASHPGPPTVNPNLQHSCPVHRQPPCASRQPLRPNREPLWPSRGLLIASFLHRRTAQASRQP